MLADESMRQQIHQREASACAARPTVYRAGANVHNGKGAGVGIRCLPGIWVVNGQAIEPREADSLVFIANKPGGHRQHHGRRGRRQHRRLLPQHLHLHRPARSRTPGAHHLLTNHGDSVKKILRAGNDHEKEYLGDRTSGDRREFVRGMVAGVPIPAPRHQEVQEERAAVRVSHHPGAGAPAEIRRMRALRLRGDQARADPAS